MPTAVSQTLDDATALDDASLRLESSEAFSESVAKGSHLDAARRRHGGVQAVPRPLVVSKGPERYDVPKLVGAKARGSP